jgi:hypothetical protein
MMVLVGTTGSVHEGDCGHFASINSGEEWGRKEEALPELGGEATDG